MAALEAIHLEHVPADYRIYAVVFKDVSNADFLHSQLIGRNSDFEYAFIDASSVLSRLQVLAAVYKGVTAQLDGSLMTPNVHSETVCSLSSSTNISEAYRRWGITPTTKDLVVVKVVFPTEARPEPPSADAIWAHLVENVKGTPLPLDDETIGASTDWPKVRKYYKLNGAPAVESAQSETEKRRELEMLALAGMALRGL